MNIFVLRILSGFDPFAIYQWSCYPISASSVHTHFTSCSWHTNVSLDTSILVRSITGRYAGLITYIITSLNRAGIAIQIWACLPMNNTTIDSIKWIILAPLLHDFYFYCILFARDYVEVKTVDVHSTTMSYMTARRAAWQLRSLGKWVQGIGFMLFFTKITSCWYFGISWKCCYIRLSSTVS